MSRTWRDRATTTDATGRVIDRPRTLRRSRLLLVGLSVLALILHFPFALAMSLGSDAGPVAAGVRIAVAAASPALFLVGARWPGLRVAVIGGLTLLDILLWAASAGPVAEVALSRDDHGWPGEGPGPGPGGMWAQGFTGPEMTPFYAAFLFAVVAAIVRGRAIWAIASAAGVWLGALLLGPLLGVDWSVGRVASATIGLLVTTGIGAFVRRRRESRRAAEAAVEAKHQDVIQAERLRIARDLHDVLGHSLSQINVQAGVGEHLIDRDPDQAKRALAAIKELSRTGLNEVRTVLHTMRSDAEALAPVRGLDDLPALIATMTDGMRITLDDRRAILPDGSHENPGSAADSAAFRIVQEGLTNILRHSGATSATVEIDHIDGSVHIDIRDDGRGFASGDDGDRGGATGTGIIGMRERAKLLEGSLSITSAIGAGTHISVRLPWAGGRRQKEQA